MCIVSMYQCKQTSSGGQSLSGGVSWVGKALHNKTEFLFIKEPGMLLGLIREYSSKCVTI